MSRIFLKACAGVFCVFCTVANATNVGGLISANTVWDTAGSPYVVTGSNLLVDTLVTLTIQPGVTVRLDSAKAIMVKGRLIAVGTAADSIVITKNGTARWARLWFKPASVCSLKYCRVEYAGNTAIYNDAGSLSTFLYIGYCTVSNNLWSGIYTCSQATITNNVIADNSGGEGSGLQPDGNGQGGGIDSWSYGPPTLIINNIISNNSASYGGGIIAGGASGSGDTMIVANNTISNNLADIYGGGICLMNSGTAYNNTISSNSVGANGIGGGGIYLSAVAGTPIPVTSNTISNNSAPKGGAIYDVGTTSGTGCSSSLIRYNSITDISYIAIYEGVCNAIIRTNNISATGLAVYNDLTVDADARYNYWNSLNTDTINARLFDYYDDFAKGIVYYKPFLKAPFSDTVAPSAPLNVTAATITDSSFAVTWTSPSDPSGISEYYYKTGQAPVSDFDTTGSFHVAPDTLISAEGMLYVWLVDSSGNLNYRNNDSVMLTHTGIRAGKSSAALRLSFSVMSGRSLTGSVLRYDVPEKTQVSLLLFDISGRLVKTMFSGSRERGCYTQTLRENDLPSAGMYYVRFRAGEFTLVKRLAVLR